MTGKVKKGKGLEIASKILDSKQAYDKFKEIIRAQGGNIEKLNSRLHLAKFSYEIKAEKTSFVKHIDNKKISKVSRYAGCPSDKASGMYLNVHKGYKVKKNEIIAIIYAETKEKLNFAVSLFKKSKPIILK
jgi:thymidine phosphorylase